MSIDTDVRFRWVAVGLAVLASVLAQLVPAARAEAVFAGANGRVAFSADGSVYTVRPDGTGLKRLAGGSAPQWSQDGRKIAFVAVRDGYFDIHAMNADGSNQVDLTASPGVHDRDFAWSPDGTKLAFIRDHDTGDGSVYVMNRDGTEQARLTSPGSAQMDLSPRWSPDGQKIVFSRAFNAAAFQEIFVMNADGSGQTNLTNFQATRSDPQTWASAGGAQWSPDGTRIAFNQTTKAYGLSTNVWAMHPDGSGRSRLTTGLQEVTPEWAPDSTRIAFQSRFGISIMDRNGTAQTALTQTGRDGSPGWSPDSRMILFRRSLPTADGGTEGSDVHVMNADGTSQVNLTQHVGGFAGGGDWQPLVRSTFKNGPAFCKALRDAAGEASFRERYRTFGKCVKGSVTGT